MNRNVFFLVFLLSMIFINIKTFAQIGEGGQPISFNQKIKFGLKSNIPVVTMPGVDVSKLQSEDLINDNQKEIPWRFGNNIAVDIDVKNQGIKDKLPSGDNLWRLRIYAPGAYSINLAFNNFELPSGAKLYIYNEQKTQVLGALTSNNNQIDKIFATTLIEGEAIILEYFEPSNVLFSGILHIERVTHGYRNVYDHVAKNFGTSGSCEVNVACPEGIGWENEVRSVCMLVVGGSGFCTGALINNSANDGKPYVLTANHCSTSNDFAQWVFWFNWQSPTCNNPPSNPAHNETTASGCTLKARNGLSDFCLVQMNATSIPSNFNVFYAGWSNSVTAAPSAKCIHHPDGDIKKISTANAAMISATYSGVDSWQANWTSPAVTEPGSSGSPLFDKDHRIIGQLYGGPSFCGAAAADMNDYYGKFCTSWNTGTTTATRLKEWLDPGASNLTTINGFDPNAGAVANPTAFTATTVSISQIDLSWINNAANDNVLIAFSTSSAFGTPTGSYNIGNAIAGGGTVIYNGSGAVINHTALNLSTTYYYKAWSVSAINEYSYGNTAIATTFCNVISVFPYDEGFENGGTMPTCWTTEVVAQSTISWQLLTGDGTTHPATAHGGTYNACLKDQTATIDVSKLITPTLNLSQLITPQLKFWHTQAVRQNRQDQLNVYYRTTASGAWILLSTYTGSITVWTQETINLPNTSSTYYIAFEGTAKYGYGVCIDDVNISGVASNYSVNGTIQYNNSALNAIDGATVNLMNGATQAGSTTTDINGSFSFNNIANGAYTFSVSTTKAWGGVTATDALKIKRHIASLELLTEPIRLTAADVNLSGSINSTDVLKVQRRIASLETSFTRPDWIFEIPTTGGNSITVNNANVTQNLFAICTGDVNGSYVPVYLKNANSLTVDYSSVIKANVNSIFEIPVRISEATEIGAMQLFLDFPSDIFEVVGVSMDSNENDVLFSSENGTLRVVWVSLESLKINSNDVIFTIKMRTKNNTASGSYSFEIQNESEFADAIGNVINGVGLISSMIELSETSSIIFNELNNSVNIFPNPAQNIVNCSFGKIASKDVKITVYNSLGEQISVTNKKESIDLFKLDFSTKTNGFYFIRIDSPEGRLVRKISINK